MADGPPAIVNAESEVMVPAPKIPAAPVIVAVLVRFPVTDWLPVKLLLAFSCGTLLVSRFSVTLPLVPPPVRSVPAVTAVIVPVPFEVAHTHVLPFHCRTCPLVHVVNRLSFTLPFVPPPVRPAPAVTPLIGPGGPAGPVNTISNSAGWLVVVVSLLFRANETAPSGTIASPSFAVPFSQSTAAVVTSIRTYLFLSAAMTGTAEAIALPRVGESLAVIVFSFHELVTRSTLNDPAVVTVPT